jgi:hypothetical protein
MVTGVSKDRSALIVRVKKSKTSDPAEEGTAMLRDLGNDFPNHTA